METAIIVSIFNIFPLIYTDDMFLLAESLRFLFLEMEVK